MLNQVLTLAELAIYEHEETVLSCFMTYRVISMLEHHGNYPNNVVVVLPKAMETFFINPNVPPPPVQPTVVPEIAEAVIGGVAEPQAELEPEPVLQMEIPKAQAAEVEKEEIILENAAENSSEHEASSEG